MIRGILAILLLQISLCAYAQEYKIYPTNDVNRTVDEQRGGPPELYRQVMERNQEFEDIQQYKPKPTAKRRTVELTMDQLTIPFEVEITSSYITMITFIDRDGHPYPVKVSRVGDSSTFKVCTGTSNDCKITEADLDIAHILSVGTSKSVGRANLQVMFKGLYKAVQISLVVKKNSYHEDVTIMVPASNPDVKDVPFSRTQSETSLKETDDYYARGLIDGVPVSELPDAVLYEIDVESQSGKTLRNSGYSAIYAGGNTYLKSKLRLPNPRPTAITNGFMSEVVYRFSGRTGVVSGIDDSGRVVVLKLNLPSSVRGYRESSKK
jgi:hypothetical protein